MYLLSWTPNPEFITWSLQHFPPLTLNPSTHFCFTVFTQVHVIEYDILFIIDMDDKINHLKNPKKTAQKTRKLQNDLFTSYSLQVIRDVWWIIGTNGMTGKCIICFMTLFLETCTTIWMCGTAWTVFSEQDCLKHHKICIVQTINSE